MGGMRGNTTLKGITRLDLNVECCFKLLIYNHLYLL